MTDFVFDFSHWLMWRQLLFWTVTILGFGSALFVFASNNILVKYNTNSASIALFIIMLILLGLYPIEWGYHTDRVNYAEGFLEYKNGLAHISFENKEIGFQIIQYVFSRFVNATEYMFCIALIYLSNYLIAIRRMVKSRSYWLFIAVIVSMGFTSYNVNTMRAGLALSFVILGLSMYQSKIRLIACLITAVSIHTSTIIPSAIILVCSLYNNTKLFYKLWLLSIPVSFILGGYFNTLLQGMSEDSRTSYLTNTVTNYNIGFRIDFILYSFVPMLVGGYYIFKKNFNERFYVMIYNVYLLTNIFWILVIRANFSDRFAYLSWFLIPFILVYPLLANKPSVSNPNKWLSTILAGEALFGLLI